MIMGFVLNFLRWLVKAIERSLVKHRIFRGVFFSSLYILYIIKIIIFYCQIMTVYILGIIFIIALKWEYIWADYTPVKMFVKFFYFIFGFFYYILKRYSKILK